MALMALIFLFFSVIVNADDHDSDNSGDSDDDHNMVYYGGEREW